ncbi:MAG: DUF4124 domain-containing protein [Burkholderiales bacterium]
MTFRFAFILAAMAVVGLAIPHLSVAQTYKWTDSEGKVHYSDKPPPANIKKSVTVKPPSRAGVSATADERAGAAPAGPKTAAEQEAEFRQRKVETAEKEARQKQADAEQENKKRNCENARRYLATVQDGGRISRYNAKGEVEYLEEAQYAQEAQNAKKSVDSWCN